MTREEAIIEAGIEYSIQNSPYCIGGDNFYEKARELNRNESFEAGVIWADKNPKSPWISVEDDLPCNHEELLINKGVTKKVFVLKFGGSPGVDFMLRVNGEWIWFAYENHKFWMPIPEPPKE